jgi:hypothetical protein
MSSKPFTIVFGTFETKKTANLVAYLLNLIPNIKEASLPFTKIGDEEFHKATKELIDFPHLNHKKEIIVVKADIVKHRMDPNTNTTNNYACIYRFDSNIIDCSTMDNIIKKLVNNIINISKECDDNEVFVNMFITLSIQNKIAILEDFDIEQILNDFNNIIKRTI